MRTISNRFWVGGTANWDATAGTKWATTSGGAGGAAVPTAADDVFFDAASGAVTITLNANGVCRSLNCTGFTGSFIHNTLVSLTIGDGTAGASNVALKFVAGMTYTIANRFSSITFASTSATQQTVDYAGKTIGNQTFNAASNGSWIVQSAINLEGTSTVFTLTKGSLDLNGQTMNGSGQVSAAGSSVRSLTLGAATLNLSAWSCATTTNMTLSAASATINMNVTGAFTHAGADTFGTVVLTSSGNHTITAASATFGTLTKTGTAFKTDILSLGSNITVSGTFTVNGNSAINRVFVRSDTIGTARTITAATVTTSNTDWRDITGAGAASWNLSAITGNSGDCGGNTNITFTSGTTQTATGTASFTWSTHGWTSRVPLPQDTAIVSNAFTAGRTVTIDMPRIGSVDFSASTGNVIPSFAVSPSNEVYGDCKFRTGMGAFSAFDVIFIGPATQTLTMAGNAFPGLAAVRSHRSELRLADAFISPNYNIFTANSGYVNTQGFNVSVRSLTIANTSNTNLFSTSTISFTTGLTLVAARVSAASAAFVLSTASSTVRLVNLGSASIGSMTYDVASSPGILTVTGGGTIGTLDLGSARTFTQTSSTTLTIGTTINATGSVITNGLTSVSASGSVTSPASAALTPSTEVEIVCRASNLDWTPTTPRYLISRQGNSAAFNNFAFGVSNSTSGMLFFTHSNGTTQNTYNSTAVPSLTDGSTYWLKMTWRNSDGRIQFFYAADQTTEPSSWTQIGTNVTGTTSAMNPTPTNGLEIGGNVALPRFWNGNIYRTIVRKTIGGAADFDADFTAKAWGADTFTESSSNAAVVTLTAGEAQASDGAIRFRSTVAGSAATLSKSSGTIGVEYCSIKDSTATGGASFWAINSTSVSGNTGWNFKNTYPRAVIIT